MNCVCPSDKKITESEYCQTFSLNRGCKYWKEGKCIHPDFNNFNSVEVVKAIESLEKRKEEAWNKAKINWEVLK